MRSLERDAAQEEGQATGQQRLLVQVQGSGR